MSGTEPDIAEAVRELQDSLEEMSTTMEEFSATVTDVSTGYAEFGSSTETDSPVTDSTVKLSQTAADD